MPRVEETYRVIAQELDVNIKDPEVKKNGKVNTSITMRISYEGLMFVKQPDAFMRLKIFSFRELKRDRKFPKNRVIQFLISNLGYASGLLSKEYNMVAVIRGKSYLLKKEDLSGSGRLLARKKSRVLLKKIASLPNGKIEKIYLRKIVKI